MFMWLSGLWLDVCRCGRPSVWSLQNPLHCIWKFPAIFLLAAVSCISVRAQQQIPIASGVVVAYTNAGQNSFKVILNQNVTSFSFSGNPQKLYQ
jgi:hypothetical protein